MIRLGADGRGLDEAARILRGGGVVVYPTETVYGLGADPFSPRAIEKLFAIKGRSAHNAVLLIAANREQLREAVAEWPEDALQLVQAFWPGPLSLVLPKTARISEALTGGGDAICVRCPGSEIARALCEAVGGPITSTSANRSGEAPASTLAGFALDGVDAAIDVGALPPSAPSTVYHVAARRVLREGVISARAIEGALAT
ncbi:MAG TPA: L-threonylcarbamoyladenylate synthase [Candidatus Hydrogenedentes bacterium]|nr:L-threonylcarbamoyladenylate synthase [Candidatus Hydrogenedentota bacterium]HOS02740.1 L-threonylcarbamoyladenylate synthase [Candidatus Hydrogenedentota bacterium]